MPAETERISIVIPVHNEKDVLEELYTRVEQECTAHRYDYQLVFVDDGSTDRSLEVLQTLVERDARVTVVELSRNFGQTAALAAGIDHADGDIIVTMDGDLQHNPAEIHRFVQTLDQGFDIVSGWRHVRTDAFLSRRLPSRCANLLMSKLSGMPVKDFGSTFKAYRSLLLRQVELFGELHRFIPVLAHRLGARIVEIPIEVHPRTRGTSKYGLGRAFGVFQDLVFLQFYANYITKPMRAFGKLFFLFFGGGFAIAALLLGMSLAGRIGPVRGHVGMLLFAILLMIIGVQFLVAGVLAELISRIYFRTGNLKIYAARRIHGRAPRV